jgi:protein-disulfide isomerase
VSVLPPIEEEFVSTGQVKVQTRPIAILGEESELAAQAAECANDQGRFWEFHDTLYKNQVREHNSGAFSNENLKRFAEALGLDTAAFDSCLDSGKYASKVRSDTAAAAQMGVNSTPTLFVNGRRVGNSVDELRAAIQEALGSGQ